MLRSNDPFDSFFTLQREFDRMFNQFWTDLPSRTTNTRSSFQVQSDDDQWRIDVPLPGVDPKDVSLEVAGNTLTIRAGHRGTEGRQSARQGYQYEQTLTIPQFLDLDRISAAHKHGMLELTVPVKESVKPRRIQIAGVDDNRKELANDSIQQDRKQVALK
jgi:HSP20 family molecular chaperone IbpA